jgi:hypothetical protein
MTRTCRRSNGVSFAALLLLATGCGRDDPRLRTLSTDISRDSAVAIMGGASPDRPYLYLVDGHQVEALVFRREGAEGPADSLTRAQLSPVVVVDGKVTGWGWNYWDSVAGANQIKVDPEK